MPQRIQIEIQTIFPPDSDYHSNLNNLPQSREYDQQNDPDTLSRGQTPRLKT